MSNIPEVEVTMKDLIEWDKAKRELALIKSKEMMLRQRIYKHFFPIANEGTNKVDLNEGWVLKAQRVIDRKVDLGILQAMATEGGAFQKAGIVAPQYIDWEPKLKVREYRTLSEEQRHVFDQALIIKDGSPQMEIVLPAKARKG